MRSVLILALVSWVLLFTGCASLNQDTVATDAETLVVIGVSLRGLPVQRLGHHYQFDFVNADGDTVQVTRQLRATDHFLVIEGLPAGDWTWQSISPRATPGVSGFNSVSARARPVMVMFSLADQSALMLSKQLVITHTEGLGGRIDVNPQTTSLQASVQARITNWLNTQSDDFDVELSPVGVQNLPENTAEPSLFERLFGG